MKKLTEKQKDIGLHPHIKIESLMQFMSEDEDDYELLVMVKKMAERDVLNKIEKLTYEIRVSI